jgi:diguanylate cyclase
MLVSISWNSDRVTFFIFQFISKAIMAKLFLLLFTLLNSSFLFAQENISGIEYCQIQLIMTEQSTPVSPLIKNLVKEKVTLLAIPAGKSRLRLNCRLDEQGVFTFGNDEILDVSWEAREVKLIPLAASSPSFLLPTGTFSIDFVFLTHHNYKQNFVWEPIATFLNASLFNNITMGVFYGLCLTLILYVYFMGRVVGDTRFQFYSLYVFCAATFFLLQEGQLNIFLPQQNFLLSHQFYLLFAGLTVFTAIVFIVRLTDLYATWPKLSRYGLELGASGVLLMSVLMLFLDHNNLSALLGSLMARMTLLLMLGILILVSIQAYRHVQTARLVLLSLALMVLAMVFRTLLHDVSPFLQRYALIIAFAVEAFMLAVAVSARIKNIQIDKVLAESQANTDELCNVLNRRGWDKKVKEVLFEQKTKGGIICLLYIDLDDFKQINDRWGHDAGDKVLKVVANIIRHQLRSIDSIGRIGGDEFAALGTFYDHGEAENLVIRVKERLQAINLHIDKQTTCKISASVGHVIYDEPPKGADDMLSQADESMYQIKRASKQRQH